MTMSNPFSKTTIFIIIGVTVVSLGAIIALTFFSKDIGESQSAGAHAYSTSAIGHEGLVKLLEKLEVPVIVSRSDSATKAKKGLLIIAEPTVTDQASKERLRKLVDSSEKVLLILPKWYGQAERGHRWIGDANFIPIDEITPMFETLGIEAEVTRLRTPAVYQGNEGLVAQPIIREPQLITSQRVRSLVETDGNLLLGSFDDGEREITILTDPDVLNNYGLREAANARFSIAMIDKLRNGGPVVIDETLHGYAMQPSLVKTLFRFPLVLATMQVLVCALLAVWAAMVRFGPRKASAPPIAPGKDFLIRNTAALLQFGGHHKHALSRYLQLTIGDVRRALHAPIMAPHETVAWLERVREHRKLKTSLVELSQWVESANTPQRVVEVADHVYRWRMEMTHGTDTRS